MNKAPNTSHSIGAGQQAHLKANVIVDQSQIDLFAITGIDLNFNTMTTENFMPSNANTSINVSINLAGQERPSAVLGCKVFCTDDPLHLAVMDKLLDGPLRREEVRRLTGKREDKAFMRGLRKATGLKVPLKTFDQLDRNGQELAGGMWAYTFEDSKSVLRVFGLAKDPA